MMKMNDGLESLLDKILRDNGMDLSTYKTSFIKRRIDIRMRENEIKNHLEYSRYLDTHPEEYDKLFDSLSINVTEFFRDSDVFDYLTTKLIPQLLEQKSKLQEINILSVGCATGKEPYSLALKIMESKTGIRFFKILGLDINKYAINYARTGEFNSIKNIPPSIANKYFKKTENGKYQINESVKKHTKFMVGNILDFHSNTQFDIIFCRNMLMYMEKDAQRKIFEKFHKLLHPDGYLVLGGSETIIGEPSSMFKPIMIHNRVYKKREVLS